MFADRRISKITVQEGLLEMQKEELFSADASVISSLTAQDLTMLLSSWLCWSRFLPFSAVAAGDFVAAAICGCDNP